LIEAESLQHLGAGHNEEMELQFSSVCGLERPYFALPLWESFRGRQGVPGKKLVLLMWIYGSVIFFSGARKWVHWERTLNTDGAPNGSLFDIAPVFHLV